MASNISISISVSSQFPCRCNYSQFSAAAANNNSRLQPQPPPLSFSSSSSRLFVPKCRQSITQASNRPIFLVRSSSSSADNEDEWGPEKEPPAAAAAAAAAAIAVAADEEQQQEAEEENYKKKKIYELKKQLVDSFYGTNRGLSATSETRAEIVELITQLEANNPTPAPTDSLPLLNGKWILAYTSSVLFFPLLARGTLPLVKVEEISQTIDSDNFTVENSVQFSGPLATTSISTNAKFEVRSPKRVQIKFEEGIIGTPQLTDSIELPETVEFLGQKIDLAPFRGLITSVQDTASSVAKTISSQPPLKFSISNTNAESWLLTTYLDEELRISRGEAGSVFVLIKEGSPLLTP